MLLAPSLAAGSAFLLCRWVSDSFLPSLLGGFLFGFSPYMVAHMRGHLSLVLIFPIPLIIYCFLLRVNKQISVLTFVTAVAGLILFQFLCCQEIIASAGVFAAFSFAAGFLLLSGSVGREFCRASFLVAISCIFAVIFLAPFLYYMVCLSFPHAPINSPVVYSSNLIGLVVPTPLLMIGRQNVFRSLAFWFTAGGGNFAEATAYINLAFLILISSVAITYWSKPEHKMLMLLLLVIIIASLGPRLHLTLITGIPLPWSLVANLPLLDQTLPGRFMMFAFLAVSLIVTIYLSEPNHLGIRWVLAIVGIILMIPDLGHEGRVSKMSTPPFFSDGSYARYLQRGENVLILPYGGQGMLWQAQTDMYFSLAVGYTVRPMDLPAWPILATIYSGTPCPDFKDQLVAFLAANQVRDIIVAPDARIPWANLLKPLSIASIEVGSVLLYHVPEPLVAPYRRATADQMIRRMAKGMP
jgi:hypothetical protein